MKFKNNVVVAVLAGIVAGTLLGAGTSQYAFVIAAYNPTAAKEGLVEELHGAPRGSYEYSNTRALRFGIGDLFRKITRQENDEVNFDESKYAADGPCEGLSGTRRHVCEAGLE